MRHRLAITRAARLGIALLALAGTAGCAGWPPKPVPLPTYYVLDAAPAVSAAPGAPRQGPSALAASAPTLIVSAPLAAAGYDSRRIVYMREPHKLEYFAHSEWVDTPARMLAPLIVAAIDAGSGFRAVVPSPGLSAADLRLDTELLRLQQEFVPPSSRVRLVLRATLVDNRSRRVLAWREFDETVAAASDDPQGGVAAANRAVQVVLAQLARFCSAGAASRPAPEASPPLAAGAQLPGR